jgi:DNA-binding CsgD family transcriptional regulator
MGKTRLLREISNIAQELGFRSGFGAGRQGEEIVELAAFMESVCGGPDPVLDIRKLSQSPAATPEYRFWILNDLQALLEQATIDAPIVVCIDDLQWADSGTAAALRSLPPRLESSPIFWMLAIRPSEGSVAVADAIAELLDHGASAISLPPLDELAVVEMASDVLGAHPDESVMEATSRAAGNPFLLMELLLGLREEDLLTIEVGNATLTEARLPERVANTMSQRMSRLSQGASAALTAAASLGQRFSIGELSQMTGLPVRNLLEPVQELMRSDLIGDDEGRLTFRHDLIRDGVRAVCSISVRRALDRQAAGVLLERGALPVEVALQLVQSAEPGDIDAISTLLEAAESLAVTDPAASANLAMKGLDLAPLKHPTRGPLVSRAAVSLFVAGRTSEAIEFADVALRQTLPPEQEAEVRLGICRMFLVSPDVRTDNARKALALPGLSTDMRAWLWSYLYHNLLVAGRYVQAREIESKVAQAVYESTTMAGWFPYEFAKAGTEYQESNFMLALELLDQAESHRIEGVEDTRERLAVAFRSWLMAALDKSEDALAVVDREITAAQRDRQLWAINLFETCKARQLLQMGRLAEALTLLEDRYSLKEAHSIAGAPDAASLVAYARVCRHLGDVSGQMIAVEIANILVTSTVPMVQRHGAWLLALDSARRHQPEQAYQWVCTFGEDEAREFLPLFPSEATDDIELVRIALNAGQERLAKHVARCAETRSLMNPGAQTLKAVAVHCTGLLECSPDLLAEGASLYDGASRPLWQASAFEDLGRVLAERGAKSDAVEALSRSLTLAAECDAAWDMARVRQELARLGVRKRVVKPRKSQFGWDSLTDSERKVAELVSQGLSNRAIGEQLFISSHTVGNHLRHIFAKLAVNSRVALANLRQELQSQD